MATEQNQIPVEQKTPIEFEIKNDVCFYKGKEIKQDDLVLLLKTKEEAKQELENEHKSSLAAYKDYLEKAFASSGTPINKTLLDALDENNYDENNITLFSAVAAASSQFLTVQNELQVANENLKNANQLLQNEKKRADTFETERRLDTSKRQRVATVPPVSKQETAAEQVKPQKSIPSFDGKTMIKTANELDTIVKRGMGGNPAASSLMDAVRNKIRNGN